MTENIFQPILLERELQVAVQTAREAGAKVMNFYNSLIVAEEKFGIDNFSEPVTEADRAASRIIIRNLKNNFPDDGILSEEETDDLARLETKRVWMIDPIDGTRGFINRDGDFAVQIGLAENGESILGVVYEPLSKRLFWAVKNAGAWLEVAERTPERLVVSDKANFETMVLAASRSHRNPKLDRIIETFNFAREIKRGSVGVKIGLLTTQTADIYIHLSPRTKHWDTCAPNIILEEAGGMMTDLFGEKIFYNTSDVQNHNGIVSSNKKTHDTIIRNLKPLLREFGRVRVKSRI